jgi:hypothetical protein
MNKKLKSLNEIHEKIKFQIFFIIFIEEEIAFQEQNMIFWHIGMSIHGHRYLGYC